MESKLDGQTDLHSDNSAHMWVRQNFDIKSLKMFVVDNLDLHIFNLKLINLYYVLFLLVEIMKYY